MNNRNRKNHKNNKNGKLSTLAIAARKSLLALNRIGESKAEARAEYNAKLREAARAEGIPEDVIAMMPWMESPYIHSISTLGQYIDEAERFVKWVDVKHPDVTKIQYAHRRGYDTDYIQTMIDAGYAPSTIARTTAALAKLFRCSANDIHTNRPERRYEDFTRSRAYDESKYEKDCCKYGNLAHLLRAIGVREVELEHLYPECFRDDDGNLYLHLDGHKQHTKGGKTRDVVILPQNQDMVREILSHYTPGELICPVAPSHLDIHGIRSLYAMDYYSAIAHPITPELAAERIPLRHPKVDNSRPGQVRTDAPGTYTRRSDGRVFDRRAMLIVSRSLGHSRVDVMAHSYLR